MQMTVTHPLTQTPRLLSIAQWLVVLSAAAISLPTALVGITTGLFLISWILLGFTGDGFRVTLNTLTQNLVARAAMLLWLFVGIGMIWSSATPHIAFETFGQYRELLLIPLMMSVMQQGVPLRVFYGFLAGHFAATLLAYVPWISAGTATLGASASGFHSHIPFGTFAAFLIFACLILGMAQKPIRARLFSMAGVMAFHLLFINTGRAGFVILGLLLLIFAVSYWRWRGLIAYCGVALLTLSVLYQYSPTFKNRLIEATQIEIAAREINRTTEASHARPALWINTLNIIEKTPAFGTGTGSFRTEYKKISPVESRNPHQQFLLTWAELGVPGLLLLIFLLYSQFSALAKQPRSKQLIAYGFLLAFIIHSFINSSILDNVEGHFYALLSVALWADREEWGRVLGGRQ